MEDNKAKDIALGAGLGVVFGAVFGIVVLGLYSAARFWVWYLELRWAWLPARPSEKSSPLGLDNEWVFRATSNYGLELERSGPP